MALPPLHTRTLPCSHARVGMRPARPAPCAACTMTWPLTRSNANAKQTCARARRAQRAARVGRRARRRRRGLRPRARRARRAARVGPARVREQPVVGHHMGHAQGPLQVHGPAGRARQRAAGALRVQGFGVGSAALSCHLCAPAGVASRRRCRPCAAAAAWHTAAAVAAASLFARAWRSTVWRGVCVRGLTAGRTARAAPAAAASWSSAARRTPRARSRSLTARCAGLAGFPGCLASECSTGRPGMHSWGTGAAKTRGAKQNPDPPP